MLKFHVDLLTGKDVEDKVRTWRSSKISTSENHIISFYLFIINILVEYLTKDVQYSFKRIVSMHIPAKLEKDKSASLCLDFE
jgi:hypothetical protein